jgi:hypothetical protein
LLRIGSWMSSPMRTIDYGITRVCACYQDSIVSD